MKDQDWTKYIVPTEINEGGHVIHDLISLEEVAEVKNVLARRHRSDFASRQYHNYSCYLLRKAFDDNTVKYVNGDGFTPINYGKSVSADDTAGYCPTLTLELPCKATSLKGKSIIGKIKTQKDENGQILYHYIEIGGYPQQEVDEEMYKKLNDAVKNGDKNLTQTGKLYSTIADTNDFGKNPMFRMAPEYEYNGERYVKVYTWHTNSHAERELYRYWYKVQPIKFRIRNMSLSEIKKTKRLDLVSDSIIIEAYPFYPNKTHANCSKWQNSMIRAFLNSADSMDLEKDPSVLAPLSWDFSNKGFLYEALNQTREPLKDYSFTGSFIPVRALKDCAQIENVTISPYVTKINNEALDGCKGIKKLVVPAQVKEIGTDVFPPCAQVEFEDICNIQIPKDRTLWWYSNTFEYVYISPDGSKVVLSKEEDDELDKSYIKQGYQDLERTVDLVKDYRRSLQKPQTVPQTNDAPQTNNAQKKTQKPSDGKKAQSPEGKSMGELFVDLE